jgi:hypothetical protein
MTALLLALATAATAAHAGSYCGGPATPGFGRQHYAAVGALRGCYSPPSHTLFRGGVPSTGAALDRLQADGVGLDIDLRKDDENPAAEAARAVARGMTYINIPLNEFWGNDVPERIPIRVRRPGMATWEERSVPTADAVAAGVLYLRGWLAQAGGRSGAVNAFVHCWAGEDRTGMFMRLLRQCDAASGEMTTCGGTLYPALARIYRDASARLLAVDPNAAVGGNAPSNPALETLAWLQARGGSPPCPR